MQKEGRTMENIGIRGSKGMEINYIEIIIKNLDPATHTKRIAVRRNTEKYHKTGSYTCKFKER